MIRNDKKLRRIGEPLVFSKPSRIAVPVRTDDRQVPDGFVEASRQSTNTGFDREKAVRIGQNHGPVVLEFDAVAN